MEPNWKIVSRPKLQTKVILLGTLGTNSLNSQVLQIKGTPLALNNYTHITYVDSGNRLGGNSTKHLIKT